MDLKNIWHAAEIGTVFILLFILSEWIFRSFKIRAEYTRKIVHSVGGLVSLSFPIMFDHWIYVLVLAFGFFLILQISKKLKLLPSVNNIRRRSLGSILFPVAVFTCFFIGYTEGDFLFFYIPVAILAFSDPIACLMGINFPYKPYYSWGGKKTIMGSGSFLISSFAISLLIYGYQKNLDGRIILIALLIAVATTIAEAIFGRGWDNITIPAAALLVLFSLN